MDEHKKFLADRILSEERPITYRILSRALDVNVNTAKEMLYDFYKYQNALRADSVHATYLVYGIKDGGATQSDADVDMGSSQPEHLTEQVPTVTMTLTEDVKLQDTLSQYSKVTSIHIYSLAPNPQKDFVLLADVAKSISEYATNEDPAALSKKYGTIYNPHTRRRDRKKGIPAPVPAPAAKKPEPSAKPSAASAPVKKETVPSAPVKQETPASSSTKSAPAPKKGGGGIMQSFAKAAAKPPKPKPVVKKEEDTTMALSDDGEAEDDDMPAPKKTAAETETLRQAKRKREEDLRRMMEDDDEEEEEEEKEPEDAEMEEPEPEPEPEPLKEEKEEPKEVVSTSTDGRRRGKRRVMKKKRILDDQGYMVTIQEAAWESFSEDDTPAPVKKETPSSTPASSSAKPKKGPAAKGSQGSIMSFFAKK
ncbi:hypothetical protein PWT90_01839 [Aphanocladium album]|nr:hypothetical protein PWT90_01839 [Aphanocladium album]